MKHVYICLSTGQILTVTDPPTVSTTLASSDPTAPTTATPSGLTTLAQLFQLLWLWVANYFGSG